MKRIESNNVVWFAFDHLSKFTHLKHFVSSRHGGESTGVYSSLNIGLGTVDDREIVLKNRKLLADSVEIPLESFVMQNQVHESHIQIVTNAMKGSGVYLKDSAIKATDAMITAEKGICLFAMAADCVPVLLYDPVKEVIASVHAGWRGTFKKIVEKTIQKMIAVYGCNPSDILAGIGPSIGPCCYIVGSEVRNEIYKAYGYTKGFLSEIGYGQYTLDLWYANRLQCITSGILHSHIEDSHLCTYCHSDDFYSSRFDHGLTGRFGAGIILTS